MNFNNHSSLKGLHAFLGASQYSWLNYDDEKLDIVYRNLLAKEMGTKYHELAAQCIQLGVPLPDEQKTLNMYVNDAIGYRMTPEQVLYYSDNCFGTTDAISYRRKFLRIHDLKTGKIPAKMNQLYIYAALFCLEYHVKPAEIGIETRIYQNDEILVDNPDPDEITHIMDKIKHFDKLINKLREGE